MIGKVYYLEYIELIHRPDDGGSTHLRNVGLPQRDYMILFPRRMSSSGYYCMLEVTSTEMKNFEVISDSEIVIYYLNTFHCVV
jgi:hypothetical protein